MYHRSLPAMFNYNTSLDSNLLFVLLSTFEGNTEMLKCYFHKWTHYMNCLCGRQENNDHFIHWPCATNTYNHSKFQAVRSANAEKLPCSRLSSGHSVDPHERQKLLKWVICSVMCCACSKFSLTWW